jgi:hypothetical protein
VATAAARARAPAKWTGICSPPWRDQDGLA